MFARSCRIARACSSAVLGATVLYRQGRDGTSVGRSDGC